MDKAKATLKQLFIYELLAFSPKYNSLIGEELYELLGEEKVRKLLKKLQKINSARARKLIELEAKDPKAYQKQMEQEEEEFRKNNAAFYDYMWQEEEKAEQKIRAAIEEEDEVEMAKFNAKMDAYKELIKIEADFGEKLLQQIHEELKRES